MGGADGDASTYRGREERGGFPCLWRVSGGEGVGVGGKTFAVIFSTIYLPGILLLLSVVTVRKKTLFFVGGTIFKY